MGQIKTNGQKPAVITLKAVAQHIGLTPGTVSAVLNDSPSARSIPQETKNRIHAAAKELNYKPNFFARTLRNKRTYTIGVIAEEIGDSYSSPIISGIEQYLRQRDYFFLTVAHRHDPVLVRAPAAPQLLQPAARSLAHQHVDRPLALEQLLDQVAADESGGTGDEVAHLTPPPSKLGGTYTDGAAGRRAQVRAAQ